MDNLFYEIALSKVMNVGPITAKILISYCGSAEAVFKEKKHRLEKIPNIGVLTLDQINIDLVSKDTERELEFIRKRNIEVLYFLNTNYPSRLKHYSESPIILYYLGSTDLNHPRTIAVVGTRDISEYGKSVTQNLISALSQSDVVVISGLAYGVDSMAHKSCISENIPTIGVLGHGLDKIYPAENSKLAEKMILNGGLLTQFGIGTKPDRENFPLRNRIVAGISDAVVVIETKKKGGSIITAELANEYNKDVFAFPGRITDENSLGCNELIKTNKAMLIESANDIINIMQWTNDKSELRSKFTPELFIELNDEENMIVEKLNRNDKKHIDLLHNQLNFTPGILASNLLTLEFKGVIKELPGKYYLLNN
ncbi:MAG: DNA-processing protein DprA [Saprospiraceae bacterium]